MALVNPHLQSASPALTAGASNAIAADTREGVWITDPDRGLLRCPEPGSVISRAAAYVVVRRPGLGK